MKALIVRSLQVAAVATTLLFADNLHAQGRPPGGGNFDPAQMRQQMLDRMREQFDVKDDSEWKLIGDRISALMDAQRATRGGFGGPGGRGGGRTQGGDNGGGGNAPQGKGNRQGGGGPGGAPSPEQEALQKAIEANASADEIKGKLEALRASRKAAEAKIEKLQADLKEVLSTKQEAVAVMFGLLK
jgi:hypothetical protein